MGYHPQIYCSGSHSTGRSIRSQLLHRPMRTATPIIIHCSATSQGVAPSFEQRWFRLI